MSAIRACLTTVGILSTVAFVVATAQAQTIKADHTSVDATALTASSISAAQALSMTFSHASVGGNIWSGLNGLASSNSALSHPNWTDNDRGNPGWQAKIDDFESWVAAHIDEYDVFQNKFCYIDQTADFGAYRDSMDGLVAQYPEKTFVYWTMPLMTDDADNSLREAFNEQVRAHCEDNDLPLFDIADIESHTVSGTAVSASGNEALDPAQSSDGGHLNDLGATRAAAAQWVLMAQIAGYQVEGGGTSGTGGSSSASSTGGVSGGDAPGVGGSSSSAPDGADEGDSGSSDESGCSVATGQHSQGRWAALGLVALGLLLRRKR